MTFFFDRNEGKRLPQALKLLGLDVVWHDERGFAQATHDEEWLAEAGSQGWVVITHDAKFLTNESEKRALIDAGVGCFLFAGGTFNRWEKARAFAAGWRRMASIITSETPPYLWQFAHSGHWSRLYPQFPTN